MIPTIADLINKKSDRKRILIIIFAALLLLVFLAIFYFFILPGAQSTRPLLAEFPRAYLFYDGLTISMDGSTDEFFWLRHGFAPATDLPGAPDGKGRPVRSEFSIAFERWQARGITLDVGLEAQPMCRKLGLKVNEREIWVADLAGGYQTFSIPIADEDLRSGENTVKFGLSGEGECAAVVDYISFRLDKKASDAAPGFDQRLIGGVKTDVLGTSSPCELNFYVKVPQGAHLSLTLGHDEEGDDSPGWLRIWRQGETTAGKVLWDGDFPAKGQRKLDLALGNQPDEIMLLSLYIKPKPEQEDWLYLAKPELIYPKPAEITQAKPAPLMMDDSKPKTIIFVVEDAMRWDMLPVYGNKFITTPNLDEIAKSVLVFENCYSPSNWTLPSFASTFTAQPFTRTGIVQKDTVMVDKIPTLAAELSNNGWATEIITSNVATGKRMGVSRGFQNIEELYNQIQHNPPITLEEYLPNLKEYLAQLPRQKDLFIALHLMDTHDPYTSPEQYRRYYDANYNQVLKGYPWLGKLLPEVTPQQQKDLVIAVCSSVSYFDSKLPELINLIGNYRDPSNTVYFLLSDHGEEFYDHGKVGHGSTMYEELMHIPLLVWGGGVQPGRNANYVNSMDLMPTILEMAKLAIPPDLEGVSIAGLLKENIRLEPRVIFSSMQRGIFSYKCAINAPWKLIYTENGPELYELLKDPKETQNECQNKPVMFGYLRGILLEWWREIHAGGVAESDQKLELSAQEMNWLRGLGYILK